MRDSGQKIKMNWSSRLKIRWKDSVCKDMRRFDKWSKMKETEGSGRKAKYQLRYKWPWQSVKTTHLFYKTYF